MEPMDHLQEEEVLLLWLPSLRRTLALNLEQPSTVFSGSVWEGLFSASWDREGLHSMFIISC